MGILDEAIREHLELKRQHGADDSELKQLEDDAFGPPERPGSGEDAPDPLAEAPTEFMSQPEGLEGEATSEGAEELPGPDAEPSGRRESPAGIMDLQEAPAPVEPSEEEQPAAEHEAVLEPAADEAEAEEGEPAVDVSEGEPFADESPAEAASHTTEERHAIAEHPTELYDVEGEFSVSGPSDEEDEVAPAASADLEDEEEDFFSEQRLSEELDQALEAPTTLLDTQSEPEAEQFEAGEEVESGESEERFEDESPFDDEQPEDDEEPEAAEPFDGERQDEPAVGSDDELDESDEGQPAFEDDQPRLEQEPPRGRNDESDVLEGTPDFLEETPEDDELWFEQKPPKDFDFDD